MDNPALKVCNLCQRELDRSEFNRNAAAKDGLQSNCRSCRAAMPSAASPYKAAKQKEWYAAGGKEKVRARDKVWRVENRTKYLESNRESRKRAYWRNPETERARAVEWNRANPNKVWLRDMKRRAKRWGVVEFTATYEDWLKTLEAHGGRCHYCGAEGKMHTEHRVPFARGGQHTGENIVPACLQCNVSKHQLTDVEYAEVLARRVNATS